MGGNTYEDLRGGTLHSRKRSTISRYQNILRPEQRISFGMLDAEDTKDDGELVGGDGTQDMSHTMYRI